MIPLKIVTQNFLVFYTFSLDMVFSTTALYPKANRANLPQNVQDSCSESTASLRRVMMTGFLLFLCWEQYIVNGFSHLPLWYVLLTSDPYSLFSLLP